MKKNRTPILGEVTLLVAISELVHCHAATLHTGTLGHEQMSHPGVNCEAFPVLTLTVEKTKEHDLTSDGEQPYLFVHTDALTQKGVFVKVVGHIESSAERDDRLMTVTFIADTIVLKKKDNLATKETWSLAA